MLLKVIQTILLSEAGRRLLMDAVGRVMHRGAPGPDPAMAAVGEGLREGAARLVALEEQVGRLWTEMDAVRREHEERARRQARWIRWLAGYAMLLTILVVYLLVR